jgi:hypothetical protein
MLDSGDTSSLLLSYSANINFGQVVQISTLAGSSGPHFFLILCKKFDGKANRKLLDAGVVVPEPE